MQRTPKSDQGEAIHAIQHAETEKKQFLQHGDRKYKNDGYGDPKDQNPNIRKAEKLKTAKHGTRKKENSDSRAPQHQKCHKTVPEDLKCPKTVPDDQEKADNGDPELEARRTRLKGQFHKLFNVNTTVKDFEYNVQFRKDMTVSQQKGRWVPIHIQAAVEKELNKLIAECHIEKLSEVGEDAFVSPVVMDKRVMEPLK